MRSPWLMAMQKRLVSLEAVRLLIGWASVFNTVPVFCLSNLQSQTNSPDDPATSFPGQRTGEITAYLHKPHM